MNNGSPVPVTVSSETVIKIICISLLAAAIFWIRDVVLVVLTAIVIASAAEPAIKWLMNRRLGRLISVIIVYVALATILLALFYFLVPSVLTEVSQFLAKLPTYLEQLKGWSPFGGAEAVITTNTIQSISGNPLFADFINNAQLVLTNTSQGFVKTINFVFGGALSFVLIVVLSFYFAAQEEGVADFLRVVTPLKNQRYVIDLWKRAQHKIGLWMQGQMVLILIITVLVFLGLTILDIKNALLLALLAGVFELIPVFGPILSAIPAVLVAIVDGGGITSGLLVIGLYLIIQQFENHLIYPLVVRKIVGVSPIVVILAFIVGAKLAGFLGIILAVPMATAFMEYFHNVQRRKLSAGSNTTPVI